MKNKAEKRTGETPFFWGLARRSILFRLRGNILLCAAGAVGVAMLLGAPLAGSSLRGSVRELHTQRIGNVKWVLSGTDGLLRASIADSIGKYTAAKAAPVQFLTGTASVTKDDSGAAGVNIIGVDERFWELGPRTAAPRDISASFRSNTGDVSIVVNAALARLLGIEAGGDITLRFQTANTPAADSPFGLPNAPAALRLPVESVADGGKFGNFSLDAEQSGVYNVFVPLKLLQSLNNTSGMAGAILIDNTDGKLRNKQLALYNNADNAEAGLSADNMATANLSESDKAAYENIIGAAQKSLSVKDAGLNLRTAEPDAQTDAARNNYIEVYSDRVFISDTLASVITRAVPEAVPVSAWFVNEIKAASGLSTPYSFVSTPPLDYTLSGNRIALNAWTARDLAVSTGDSVTLTYFVPRPALEPRLDSAVFAVSTILQDTVSWLNNSLTSPYPGVASAGSLIEWNPPIPVELKKIRPEDEEYWKKYHAAPKAVISYDKAAQIWANRFGVCTAVRVPNNNISAEAVEAAIVPLLTPSICGIQLTDARADADGGAGAETNFAPLLWGMSLFTFAAALLIIWLLSMLQVKSRTEEYDFLTTVGYSRKHILLIYLSEGLLVFSVGTLAGIVLSLFYALTLIAALKPFFGAAAPILSLHVEILPMLVGSAAAFACALASMLIPVFFAARRRAGT